MLNISRQYLNAHKREGVRENIYAEPALPACFMLTRRMGSMLFRHYCRSSAAVPLPRRMLADQPFISWQSPASRF